MRQQIREHFSQADPVLSKLIDQVSEIEDLLSRESSQFFVSLCDEIISQQLSGKVATVIFERFKNLFKGEVITPYLVLKLSHEQLRSTGMSNAKARFIKDLSEKVLSGELDLVNIIALENSQVVEQLTKVKGIGPWTAEMFLMFTLGREDIFSHGDLGLKNAIKKIYQLDSPTKEEIEKIVSKWSPFKTYACRILWKSLEIK
ncbi:hypothetical protein A2631_04180 [Candidatus Daviesbacteria bacterium RIFCSPHIGHO2_01_FULL_44_29]|uniref:DNA-3-methyladenine glycosylase II n=1 Tax=Candidatus Daviesbacteria bacterium RIFCSPHIGHO2_02_FULL_43_12 TaxID=1797776 RepID=A0A1F5KGK2_9BACT|nr:MAG: hypothetical protein A2631_04180 [Candidatus Daviesbacteria bacterium RIFCSPHIGHO2_01_FULL_44_29]OGE39925.1 MAG: hypothetical protein A3D25_03910 [Candidatus Daviesbacteria bacterium RIFCSPHIGHO2_02_FULL_43_12]OGE40517.1 MAG: hypothetical protein A3E86_00875 [Candidatus Daviesbacteria bacterium RIFCSPHIGHO2_12_FULL_47_45]OGE70394.1 MAG: hypothetical protein A3B55_01660 [Candidatus Daviesbacteria bacterium RIFCSPLOWO2_01_FULL_43_15]